MPLNHNCSNLVGEEGEWNGDKQKQKELKELELKNNNTTDPHSPKSQSMSTTNSDETVLAPQLTYTLMSLMKEEQKVDNIENNFGDNSETDFDLDSTIDNMV